MPIETSKSGTTVYTGEKGIKLFQLRALLSALKLQAKGIRMTRHLSATTAGRRLGFKGRTAEAMIPEVEEAIRELDPQVTRIEEA